MTPIRTTCAYCGVGCGITAVRTGERSALLRGDDAHPANHGRLCSKGTYLGETVGLEGRLLYPEIGGNRAGWDEALNLVASRFAATVAEHGPDSVAFYVSGQLLTEDYYVANKLMKGFIGSANIDTNSRLCMASAVAAHIRAFGEDIVPCSYADLDEADLILLVGSNAAWCHPVVWQRIEAARAARGTILVVIDPRRTETAAAADMHIPIAPDGDITLFNRLLGRMVRNGNVDLNYLAAHVTVPSDYLMTLASEADGAVPGVPAELMACLTALIAAYPRMVTLFSQGANQSVCGTDKGNAIINLHLALGRIGKAGMGPFSITGQPNAMGGREVGGLATMLACHLNFSDEHRLAAQNYWQSPTICEGPGLKAVEMFRAVHDGRIKALWIMATNPAVSMPDAGFVREALARCKFVAQSDIIANTDTGAFAHVKLPALGWGEKDGTVTNSERRISRQRALFAPPGEARADWAIIADVARRMGFSQAFEYHHSAQIFREYAAMTRLPVEQGLTLDLADYATVSDAAYNNMKPFQWGGSHPLGQGRFPTPDGRARMVRTTATAKRPSDSEYPMRLNTGRYRDQWHTMTRTGLSPRLSQHRREPLVEVHPDDAARHGLSDGGLANVATASGASIFRVAVDDGQARGAIFVPMHWTDQIGNGGRTGHLPDQSVDPISGQPGFKDIGARIAPVIAEWCAFMISRERPTPPKGALYWTLSRLSSGWLMEIAGNGMVDADTLLGASGDARIELSDKARGMQRVVTIGGTGAMESALFIAHGGALPPREWLAAQLGVKNHPPLALLAGKPTEASDDAGTIICVCFNVGEKRIARAAQEHGSCSVEWIGKEMNAGSNCGSCRPAIARLLAAIAPVEMAVG